MPLAGGDTNGPLSPARRDAIWAALRAAQEEPIDVLIVGGGVAGAGVLRELALRNVSSVLLIEKGDFASATSGASSKLIHAGIRYLEQMWLHLKRGRLIAAFRNARFVVEASFERKRLGRLAPGLIQPKRIYLVLARNDPRSALSVFAGVWFYTLIQLLQGQFFPPPHCLFRRAAIARRLPDLNPDAVKAAFGFWDSETDDARLVIDLLRAAAAQGARAVNYVELLSTTTGADGVVAVLRNNITGETATVRARTLINCAGPFVDEVRARAVGEGRRASIAAGAAAVVDGVDGALPTARLVDRVAGAHVDIYPSLTDASFYITAADGRLVFVLRRDEDGLIYSRIGTTERPLRDEEPTDNPEPTEAEIDYLLDLVSRTLARGHSGLENIVRHDRKQTDSPPHSVIPRSLPHSVIPRCLTSGSSDTLSSGRPRVENSRGDDSSGRPDDVGVSSQKHVEPQPFRIVRTDAAIRPLRAQGEMRAFHKSREHDIVFEGRVAHVVGVKLTDFRRVAVEVASKMPWARWGVSLSRPRGGAAAMIRPAGSARLYPEATMEETMQETMCLRPEDYVARRRGLAPFLRGVRGKESQ